MLLFVFLKLFPSTGLQGALRVTRYKFALTVFVVLLAVGCSKSADEGNLTKVKFDVSGMT